MNHRIARRAAPIFALAAAAVLFAVPVGVRAQQGRGPALTPKAGAPIDITGYWVALVTEDWRYRMMTPAKGDYPNVPLNPAGRRVADAWDPAKDEAAGEQCKGYGAGNVMRNPERIHITWENDTTLKVEADNGTQTRLFYFSGAPQAGEPTYQGISVAQWEIAGGRAPRGGGPPRGGDLKIVTTHMKPGYIQRNGVPYSANAVITEHYDLLKEPNGESYLLVTTLIEDPQYLNRPFQRSTHFKKQADASGWDPTPCSAR
jgi:hypothetical protein